MAATTREGFEEITHEQLTKSQQWTVLGIKGAVQEHGKVWLDGPHFERCEWFVTVKGTYGNPITPEKKNTLCDTDVHILLGKRGGILRGSALYPGLGRIRDLAGKNNRHKLIAVGIY